MTPCKEPKQGRDEFREGVNLSQNMRANILMHARKDREKERLEPQEKPSEAGMIGLE